MLSISNRYYLICFLKTFSVRWIGVRLHILMIPGSGSCSGPTKITGAEFYGPNQIYFKILFYYLQFSFKFYILLEKIRYIFQTHFCLIKIRKNHTVRIRSVWIRILRFQNMSQQSLYYSTRVYFNFKGNRFLKNLYIKKMHMGAVAVAFGNSREKA